MIEDVAVGTREVVARHVERPDVVSSQLLDLGLTRLQTNSCAGIQPRVGRGVLAAGARFPIAHGEVVAGRMVIETLAADNEGPLTEDGERGAGNEDDDAQNNDKRRDHFLRK